MLFEHVGGAKAFYFMDYPHQPFALFALWACSTNSSRTTKMHINKPEVLAALLAQEDTTGSKTITVEDEDPSISPCALQNGDAPGVRAALITWPIYCRKSGWARVKSTLKKITLPPLERIDFYLMRTHYWRTLTRRMDADKRAGGVV